MSLEEIYNIYIEAYGERGSYPEDRLKGCCTSGTLKTIQSKCLGIK